MKFNFTIDLKELEHPDEAIECLRAVCKFLSNVTPDYYIIGDMLKDQLEKQIEEQKMSEEDKMKEQWQMFYEHIVDVVFSSQPEKLKKAIEAFEATIGEAMGPVCYAGYNVTRCVHSFNWTNEITLKYAHYVDTCIKYYEENYSGVK